MNTVTILILLFFLQGDQTRLLGSKEFRKMRNLIQRTNIPPNMQKAFKVIKSIANHRKEREKLKQVLHFFDGNPNRRKIERKLAELGDVFKPLYDIIPVL